MSCSHRDFLTWQYDCGKIMSIKKTTDACVFRVFSHPQDEL